MPVIKGPMKGGSNRAFALKKYNRTQQYVSGNVARAQVVNKLAKKVNRIAKAVKEGVETVYLNANGSNTLSTNFLGINLCDWSTQSPVFDDDPTESAYARCNKFTWKSMKLDLIYDCNNEYENVDLTTFIVSVKDEASKIYDKATGVLTLTSGLDYKRNSATSNSGQVYLNPKVFNIHYVKRSIIGNNSQNPTTAGNSTEMKYIRRRIAIKLKVNKICKNPYGDIDLLTCNPDPSKQYYLLVFNNNLATDLQYPLLDWNLLNTIICPS